ncbi:hypothetical protein C0J52_26048 [Blattella germanica]|nr:hypothetical protein C0J52_26048 [Blattella germanica]
MNGYVFKNRFESIISKLEPNSAVVLDNAPYHRVKSESIPNTSWRKGDIISWLQSKYIQSLSNVFIPLLLKIIYIYNTFNS